MTAMTGLPTPAYASLWVRILQRNVGRPVELELDDGSRCCGQLERVEADAAVLIVEGRVQLVSLDQVRAVEELDGKTEARS